MIRPKKMPAEAMAEWEAWLATRPPRVAAVARAYPAWKVYTMPDSAAPRAQYAIASYQEPLEDGAPVTLKVDRYDGGEYTHTVFGVLPEDLQEERVSGSAS